MVAPTEDPLLSRFIFSKSDIKYAKKQVRPRVFMPPPDLKLSVFDIEALEVREIWHIGSEVAAVRSQTLHARADIQTSSASAQGLRVSVDEPPLRHRIIEGWPANQKEDQKLIAMQLAADAALHVPNETANAERERESGLNI
jgi:hypothetical protein